MAADAGIETQAVGSPSLFARVVERANGGGLPGFFVRRLAGLAAVIIFLLFATFVMVRLIPGDPAQYVVNLTATKAQLDQVDRELGTKKPFFAQGAAYMERTVHGDFGRSFQTNEAVSSVIRARLGNSLQLAGTALILVLVVSISGGLLLAAVTRDDRHRAGEATFTAVSSIVGAIPEYLAATFLAFIFAVWLKLLPIAGSTGWQSLVLPVGAVALRPMANLMRIVRVEGLNVLAQDYMRTAQSKRLPARLIYLRHALPNVIAAALTIGGVLFASLIGGAVVVENVFNRPGLGTALAGAIQLRDYPVIQAGVVALGIIVIGVNTLVDLLLAIIDPRSRTRET